MYFIKFFRTNSDQYESQNLENGIDWKEAASKMEPSEESVKNILDFARSYDVMETESAGYVEMILN